MKSYPPVKVEPLVSKYFTCEKCSFTCYLSDQKQVESHNKNCRTQLFDKFKLPIQTSQGGENSQNSIPSPVSRDTTSQLTAIETTDNPPEVSPDVGSDKESLSSDTDHEDVRSQETDILDKYDTDDDLDLCLDSEYFI